MASIEQRIAGIDEQIADLAGAKSSLERALAELQRQPDAPQEGAQRQRRAAPKRTASRSRRQAGGGRTRRAPAGQNRQLITDYLSEHGPAPASAIARATGVNRAVVYNNLKRMEQAGAIRQAAGDDGRTVFSVAS